MQDDLRSKTLASLRVHFQNARQRREATTASRRLERVRVSEVAVHNAQIEVILMIARDLGFDQSDVDIGA